MGEVRFFMDNTTHAWLKQYAEEHELTLKDAVEKIIADWRQETGD